MACHRPGGGGLVRRGVRGLATALAGRTCPPWCGALPPIQKQARNHSGGRIQAGKFSKMKKSAMDSGCLPCTMAPIRDLPMLEVSERRRP